jgi:hypothetical protein
LTSFAITVWIAFGQTLARQAGLYNVAKKPTSIDGCPVEWLNMTTANEAFINQTLSKAVSTNR